MAIFSFVVSTSRRVTSTRGPPGSTTAGLASATDAGASNEALKNAAAAKRLRKAFAFVIVVPPRHIVPQENGRVRGRSAELRTRRSLFDADATAHNLSARVAL